MPKSKQYEDAMGSVFDFIFEQTKQKPSKVKPVSPTGIDGSGEFVDALSAVLENPLLFVNNNSLAAFQEAANVNLGAFQVGKRGTDKIKISFNDLQDALSNPSSFIDKRYKKLEDVRKFTRLTWAGEEMKGLLGGVWARSKGLDFETQQALIGSAKTGTEGGLHTPQALIDMSSRNAKLMEKHFGNGNKKLTKDDFEKIYGQGSSQAREAFEKYNKAFKTFTEKSTTGEAAFDRNTYSILESLEIREKALSATTKEQKDGYEAAANMIENSKALQDAKSFINSQKAVKKNLLEEIEQLKRIPGSQNEIDAKRKELRIINMNLRDANQFRLGEQLGEFEGSWSTLKSYTVGGALLPSIISRDFFDPGRNQVKWLQPSEEKTFIFGQEWDPKTKGFIDIKMKIHVGKSHKNKFVANVYDKMNNLYYLSPVTWIESLYTGEMFAFMAEKGRSNFQKSVESIISKKIGNFKLDSNFLESLNRNDKKIIDLLEGKLSQVDIAEIYKNFPSLEKLIDDPKTKKLLQKFLKSDSSLRDLTKFFNSPTRFKDKISKALDKLVGQKIRDKVGNALLKTALIKNFGSNAIKLWMKSGGIQLLVQTLVSSIASAIGLTAGPIGSAIANVISFVAMDLVYAITKPLMKGALYTLKIVTSVVFFVTLGFLIFIVLIVNPFFDTHAGIAPSEVKYCTASGTNPIIDPDNDPNDPSDDIKPSDLLPFLGKNLPAGEECLLGEGAYNCTQGAFGSYSHSNVAAIDLTGVDYFHAPSFCDNGSCEITYSGPINCTAGYAGGMVKMKAEYEGNTYEFKLIHVDTKYTVGDKISGGESVARVMEFSETGNACSSGKHLHLETSFNGSPVNPYDMMTSSLGNGGFACPVSLCP